MKQITGGALYRKIKMYKRFQGMAMFALTIIGFLIFGSMTNDILTGIGLATMVPVFLSEDSKNYGQPFLGGSRGKDGDDPSAALELKIKEFNEKQAENKKEVDGLKLELKKLQDEKAGSDKLKEVTDSIEKSQKEMQDRFKEIQDVALKQGTEITLLKQKQITPSDIEHKSLKEAMYAAFEEKKDEIDTILKNGGKQNGPLRLELKVAVDHSMTNTLLAVGSASHYSLTSDTGIISTLRKRIMTYLSNVSVGQLSVDKPYAMWIEELDEQGTPIFIAEGAAKTQLSVRYEEREKKAKKIAVYGKVTTEFLRYLPKLVSYVQNNLMRRMDIKTEDQLFNGDDAGDNLKGLISYATAFDGGIGTAGGTGLVGQVKAPNMYDVIRAIALQVENSYGMASKVFVKTDIVARMDIEKDSQDRYVLPPFKSANGTTVAGLEIVPTIALNSTSYDFVGGDLSVVNVEFLNQVGIQIGLDGSDFTTNKKTILVEQELVQFVSANDTQVLVKGVFADAITLLTIV